jgi:hypothetical protein
MPGLKRCTGYKIGTHTVPNKGKGYLGLPTRRFSQTSCILDWERVSPKLLALPQQQMWERKVKAIVCHK